MQQRERRKAEGTELQIRKVEKKHSSCLREDKKRGLKLKKCKRWKEGCEEDKTERKDGEKKRQRENEK